MKKDSYVSSFNRAVDKFAQSPEPLTPQEISERRTSKTYSTSRFPRIARWTTAGLAGLAFAHFTYDTSPSCEGSKKVNVQPGNTVAGLLSNHVQAPDGYVDLRQIDYSVERINMDGTVTNLAKTALITPGDVVTMPVTCK